MAFSNLLTTETQIHFVLLATECRPGCGLVLAFSAVGMNGCYQSMTSLRGHDPRWTTLSATPVLEYKREEGCFHYFGMCPSSSTPSCLLFISRHIWSIFRTRYRTGKQSGWAFRALQFSEANQSQLWKAWETSRGEETGVRRRQREGIKRQQEGGEQNSQGEKGSERGCDVNNRGSLWDVSWVALKLLVNRCVTMLMTDCRFLLLRVVELVPLCEANKSSGRINEGDGHYIRTEALHLMTQRCS